MLSAVAAGIRCIVVPNPLNRCGDFSPAHRVVANVREVAPEISRLRATS
jgi:hypothetical protein